MATTTRSSISVNPDSFRNLNLSIVNTPFVHIFPFVIRSVTSYGNGGHKQLDHKKTVPLYSHLLGKRVRKLRLKMSAPKIQGQPYFARRRVTTEGDCGFSLDSKNCDLLRTYCLSGKESMPLGSLTTSGRDHSSLRKRELDCNKICYWRAGESSASTGLFGFTN